MITNNKHIKSYKLIILGLIFAAGIFLYQLGLFESDVFIEIGEKHFNKWWFIPLVILVKALLYAFALPGSVMYLVAALFYQPVYATIIIVAGGVSGAIAAYYFSSYMSHYTRKQIQTSKAFSIMQKNSDFATLSAIRSLPGFPHSVINYGSGLLNIPLPRFVITAIIGFSAKGFLYSSAIHHAARAEELSDTGGFKMILPLVLLAFLFIIGKVLYKKLSK